MSEKDVWDMDRWTATCSKCGKGVAYKLLGTPAAEEAARNWAKEHRKDCSGDVIVAPQGSARIEFWPIAPADRKTLSNDPSADS